MCWWGWGRRRRMGRVWRVRDRRVSAVCVADRHPQPTLQHHTLVRPHNTKIQYKHKKKVLTLLLFASVGRKQWSVAMTTAHMQLCAKRLWVLPTAKHQMKYELPNQNRSLRDTDPFRFHESMYANQKRPTNANKCRVTPNYSPRKHQRTNTAVEA